MPKEYTYQKRTFTAEELVGMLGGEAVEATTESFDQLVKTRDAGSARILAAYRADRGLGK